MSDQMIIDCHGHYTTAPSQLQQFRDTQLDLFSRGISTPPALAAISDDEIRESIELNQLRALRERGADMTIFSPKASAMAHHQGDESVSKIWTRINNDLIHRVTTLFPQQFAGVCQLPQSQGVPIAQSIEELTRC
uniref:amidohydrolase family protein n=1 Tax=Paracoccus sp. TaxID=267 RepID=UPI0028A2ACDD